MLYMLDTDTTSYLIKGHSPQIEARLENILPSKLCISAVTRAELRYGLKRLPPEHHLHMAVHHFFKIVRVLSWDAEAADWYADIRYQLVSGHQLFFPITQIPDS